MRYTTAIITTNTRGIDAVTGSLMNLGINGFEVRDAADFAEFLADTTPNWDYVDEALVAERTDAPTTVTAYLPDNAQGAAQLEGVREELARLAALGEDFGPLTLRLESIADEDWENNWKQYFKPFPVGRSLFIRPPWEEADPGDRRVLCLDPGCAFGSGQHHTTQLCMGLLEDTVRPGDHVLDMGCGSGILSVASAALGAREIMAVDIDENAIRMTLENWEANAAYTDPVTLCAFAGNVLNDEETRAEISGAEPFDVVAANIVADVLIAMAPLFPGWLAPEGTLVVSGILLPRADEVLSVLRANGFVVLELREQDEWAAARCRLLPR